MNAITKARFQMVPGEADYPRNAWYVAAFSHEVEPGKLLHRTLCDEPLALFRKEDGTAVAMFDRCPHRGLPLSMGRLLPEDRVQCVYHGLEFNAEGKCAHIPFQDNIPQAMKVKTYPLVEMWAWIWFWPGDPEKADPALIPDHHALGLTDPDLTASPAFVVHWDANYLMPLENGPDGTHVGYLHGDYFERPVGRDIAVEQEGRVVRTTRKTFGIPFYKGDEFAGNDIPKDVLRDMIEITETHVPSTGMVHVKLAPTGTEDWQVFKSCITVTPETRTSSWEFFTQARNFTPVTTPDQFGDVLRTVQDQDLQAGAAIQARFDELGGSAGGRAPYVDLRTDEQQIRARRMTAQMIEAERATA